MPVFGAVSLSASVNTARWLTVSVGVFLDFILNNNVVPVCSRKIYERTNALLQEHNPYKTEEISTDRQTERERDSTRNLFV